MRQCGFHQQAGNNQQKATNSQTVTRTHKDIDTFIDTTRQQSGKGATQCIQDNQSVAQQGECPTLLISHIQRQDTRKTNYASQHFPISHLVALKEDACQNH